MPGTRLHVNEKWTNMNLFLQEKKSHVNSFAVASPQKLNELIPDIADRLQVINRKIGDVVYSIDGDWFTELNY